MTKAMQAIADSKLMLALLQDWATTGWIRWLDAELAALLYEQADNHEPASPLLLLAAALTSHQSGHGHVCLDLQFCLSEPDQALSLPPEYANVIPEVRPANVLSLITIEQWLAAIADPAFTNTRSAKDDLHQVPSGDNPLILVQSAEKAPMLYLRRFWQYEQQISKAIQQRLLYQTEIDIHALKKILDTLFKEQSPEVLAASMGCDWQKIACALAIRSHFAIITGGPGTGKTTTVVRLLKALDELHGNNKKLRIKMAAPTGKAAVRLSESIASQRNNIAQNENLPTDVSTVHRLLGPIPGSRYFRHNAGNPLAVDVVVIDEASMVDVELMAQLMDALPTHARLILLGDKDQLASVEAGAVLGSLCSRANHAHFKPEVAAWINQVCGQTIPSPLIDESGNPLDQAITMLRYSHRFGNIPGIGRLADAVNNNAAELTSLFDGQYAELKHLHLKSTRDSQFNSLVTNISHGYGHYLQELGQAPCLHQMDATKHDIVALGNWAAKVLHAFGQFRVLAALRKGEFGVEELNLRIESALSTTGLLSTSGDLNSYPGNQQAPGWYSGRPVMLTRNDYALQLMNGDIGIALPYPDVSGRGIRLRVAFADSQQIHGIRWILPSRLQHVETVFAMTVHKSQGSEFSHTALVLPPHDNPILTRELLYTAITRASARFTLASNDLNVLQSATGKRVFRVSGLAVADNP